MHFTFVSLLLTALLFIVLDFLWFQFSLPRFYGPTFEAIQGHELQFRAGAGVFAWVLLAFGIQYFVLDENVKTGQDAFIRGALMGFIIYGVYNGTNYATLSNYNMSTFVADNIWGTLVSGTVAYLAWNYIPW